LPKLVSKKIKPPETKRFQLGTKINTSSIKSGVEEVPTTNMFGFIALQENDSKQGEVEFD
jgi:hypothetical protein